MLQHLKDVVGGGWKRTLLAGVGLLTLGSLGGCTVHEDYYASGPRRVYYYGPRGEVYVRDYPAGYTVATVAPAPSAPAPSPAVTVESPAAEALHPVVAPIALYPDPLLAVLLPATTYPQQISDAAAWLQANPNPPAESIDVQPWDVSVKALVRYPTVLNQLAKDMQWTESLGSAYASQPADVSAAIQQMRAQASGQGNLTTTSQVTVINDGGVIAIQPATTEVVYVPSYDPVLVYVGYHPWIFTDVYYPLGPWCLYGWDWYGGGVLFVGDWHGGYYYRGGRWGRDYAWHNNYHRWEHDARFGAPPHIDRQHYAVAAAVHGREAEIHRTMVEHAVQRHTVQHTPSYATSTGHSPAYTTPRSSTPGNYYQNPNGGTHYATPDRTTGRPSGGNQHSAGGNGSHSPQHSSESHEHERIPRR